MLIFFRKDCHYVGHKQTLGCYLRKQHFNQRCNVQGTYTELTFKKGNSFVSRVQGYGFLAFRL